MNIRTLILWIVAIGILLFVNYGIYGKELLIRTGEPVLLELAPVDPRSLIQGDYMDLRYEIATGLEDQTIPRRGALVITLDEHHVAHFVRIDDDDMVAVVDVRRVGRFVLAAEPAGHLGGEATKHLVLCVDEVPVLLYRRRRGGVGLHLDIQIACAGPRCWRRFRSRRETSRPGLSRNH